MPLPALSRRQIMKWDDAPDYAAWSFYLSAVELLLDLLSRLPL